MFLMTSVMALCILIGFRYSRISAYTEKDGTINGTYVNIRKGAGTSYDKLVYNGNNVQLNVGDSVHIINESNASDGALWYQIRFSYSGSTLTGYVHSAYVDVETSSYVYEKEFEDYLTAQGFPDSYKDGLRKLHAKYPKWVFLADQLNYQWSDVISQECVLGRSLVSKNVINSWKSLQEGSYNWSTGTWATFDGGSWVAASPEYVSYCMDPRNFLDERYIFQFEMLSFNASIHKQENVKQLLEGSFMYEKESVSGVSYEKTFMDAAARSSVSPYHLVSRVIQEVGYAGTTGGVTGYYAPSTGNVYNDLYNFYNIGAYAANGRGAVENGLIYASKTDEETLRPWNTKYKAIVGGAIFIGKGYINIGQDTIYYEKFDFAGTPYTHQYMTNVSAPKSEASKMANAYSSQMKNTIALAFKIPVFKNMPQSPCPCPTGDGSPNNVLNSLSVDGYQLTPTFSKFTTSYDLVVPNEVTAITVKASPVDSSAAVSGTGRVTLKEGLNEVKISVKAEDGSIRVYTISVVRNSGQIVEPPTEDPTEDPTEKPTDTTVSYRTSDRCLEDIYLVGIEPGTSVDEVKSHFTLNHCSLQVFRSDGRTAASGKTGTGMIFRIIDEKGNTVKEYTSLIYGDISGDGQINLIDLLYQKRHILGMQQLSDVWFLAGDINKKGEIDLIDMLYVKRQILGMSSIKQ